MIEVEIRLEDKVIFSDTWETLDEFEKVDFPQIIKNHLANMLRRKNT